MSGALSSDEADDGLGTAAAGETIARTDAHIALIGSLAVARALPQRKRRTIGAWCFLDHFGPAKVVEGDDPQLGPHPHIGLHTVTWLYDGEALHKDSLGSEQAIRPGQLNIMTAGHGIAHAEDMLWNTSSRTVHGLQLWIAQPHATRNSSSTFAHHASLPSSAHNDLDVTVLVGEVGATESPARVDSALVGADIVARGAGLVPLDASFEHGVFVVEGSAIVNGNDVATNQLLYLPPGHTSVDISSSDGAPARLMLLGGIPFGEQLFMWWNFVGRTKDEIDDAQRSWNSDDGRFGRVESRLSRIAAPTPIWH